MEINYGDKKLNIAIDDKNIAFVLRPKQVPGIANLSAEIDKSLMQPICTLPLIEMAKNARSAIILADDNTRLTPTKVIIPKVLEHLNKGGIKDDSIAIFVASGSHRHMTNKEKADKYGQEVMDRILIIDHEYANMNELRDLGKLKSGTSILINRKVLEYDLRIGIGTIMPHCPAGWSGGAKILLPGAAGLDTVSRMHLLGAGDLSLGIIRTKCRTEMEGLARKVGLEFIVNTILNDSGEAIDIVAGHYIKAHREGVRIARKANGTIFEEHADLVISSTYPVDYDLFQADKGLFSGVIALKPGGTLLMLSPCHEGISPAHPSLVDIGTLSDDEILTGIKDGSIQDALAGAEAMYLNSVKRKCKEVILATEGISSRDCEKMGFRHLSPAKLQSYIEKLVFSSPDIRIGILSNGAEVLPIFRAVS